VVSFKGLSCPTATSIADLVRLADEAEIWPIISFALPVHELGETAGPSISSTWIAFRYSHFAGALIM
jgi:hypothetical protein